MCSRRKKGIRLIVCVGRALQVVSHDSDAPDVHLLGVGLHQPDLRSHVDGSAADRVQFSVGEDLADAEVGELQQGIGSIGAQQYVFRLFISCVTLISRWMTPTWWQYRTASIKI